MTTGPKSTVIADTSVLINFLHIERLDLLEDLPGYTFHVSEHVVSEVTDKAQASQLASSLDAGRLRVITMTDTAEMARYGAFLKLMGKGESASLAIAESRGWFLACDEKRRFLRQASASIGIDRVLNTVSLLVIAILKRRLTIKDADEIKALLKQRHFEIKTRSFQDLLPCPGRKL